MKLGILYSGGKDSNYALFKSLKQNRVECLITLSSQNPNSYMFQSVGNNLIEYQSKALEIPLIKFPTKGEKEKELEDLKSSIKLAKEKYEIEGIVTGAIKSCYQSSRIQKICLELDIKCFNPLWQIDENEYMDELLKNNFEIKIFGVFSYPFTQKYLGKEINKKFLDELKELRDKFQISIAGEGGEYESFVTNSPNFKKKLNIKKIKTNMDSENSGIITNCEVELLEK